MRTSICIASAAILALCVSASAQEADRYRMERTENGFMRMDTRTGAMSFCLEQAGQLACKPADDVMPQESGDTADLREKIDRLERRLSALEGRAPAAGLPSEEEFEKTMGFMERFLRRFWGVAKDLERESEPGVPPAPNRT